MTSPRAYVRPRSLTHSSRVDLRHEFTTIENGFSAVGSHIDEVHTLLADEISNLWTVVGDKSEFLYSSVAATASLATDLIKLRFELMDKGAL